MHRLGIARRRVLWSIIILLAVGSAATSGFLWLRPSTYHFAEVHSGVLYRDGNRSMRQFAATCRRAGIKTVVMLNDDAEIQREPFKSEGDFCRDNGITLQRIPIAPGQRPTTADVRRFLDILAEKRNQPVLVHCAQGVRRTGMMVAAYQRSVLNYDAAKAKEAILLLGRKSASLDDVRGFIDDYDPVTRAVASSRPTTHPRDQD